MFNLGTRRGCEDNTTWPDTFLVLADATCNQICSVFSLNNMEDLLIVERLAFQNLPDMVKLELNNNPHLSYIHPQAFRCGTLSV